MYKHYALFLLLFLNLNFSLQNQKNISIEKNKINIFGEFNGRKYENILINNKTEITLYEKPDSEEGDPYLLQYNKSLIPNLDNIIVYIKQIKYVPPIIKDVQKNTHMPLLYNKQKWYEVKITFSNNESKNYLLPESTSITMTDTLLGMHSNMKVSALIGEGIVIKGIEKNYDGDKDRDKDQKRND